MYKTMREFDFLKFYSSYKVDTIGVNFIYFGYRQNHNYLIDIIFYKKQQVSKLTIPLILHTRVYIMIQKT